MSAFELDLTEEGDKLLALSKCFAEQLSQRIENGKVTDLNRDYSFKYDYYVFYFRFAYFSNFRAFQINNTETDRRLIHLSYKISSREIEEFTNNLSLSVHGKGAARNEFRDAIYKLVISVEESTVVKLKISDVIVHSYMRKNVSVPIFPQDQTSFIYAQTLSKWLKLNAAVLVPNLRSSLSSLFDLVSRNEDIFSDHLASAIFVRDFNRFLLSELPDLLDSYLKLNNGDKAKHVDLVIQRITESVKMFERNVADIRLDNFRRQIELINQRY